ncbi:hypothetical protein chiPu_0003749 [Chiloscyllium punctatum]|uniref:Uncharacterized protein n=1 Tax=Chiloscyllium punctatum TaxID=137246 RepID=A0A401S4R8_CHIPU|nr:hypothetical protein [Chiloscyllium punctatum]
MSCQESRDHVAHAVERFQKDKEKLSEQQEEVQRKLAQMQLEEHKKEEKEKAKKVLPSFLVRVTTQQLVVISATPGSAYSSDGTPPFYSYDLTTSTVQGICPCGDVNDTSEECTGPGL